MSKSALACLWYSLVFLLAINSSAQADENDVSLSQTQKLMPLLLKKQEAQLSALLQISKEIGTPPTSQQADVRSILKTTRDNLQNLRSQKIPLLFSKDDFAKVTKQIDDIRDRLSVSVDLLGRAKSPVQARADMQALVAPILRENDTFRKRSDYLEWYMWAMLFYECPSENPNCSRPSKP